MASVTKPAVDATTPEPAPAERQTLTRREHFITCFLGTWMLTGLYLDGWAHRSIDLNDSITTPWHLVLYTGWTSFASWLLWLVVRGRNQGLQGRAAVPAGYGPGVIGVFIFGTGAIGDQFWHLSWGVEQDLNAFLSPTHWCLAVGMFLMVSSPLRAGWFSLGSTTPTLREFAPWLWSMLLTTAMATFTLNYLSTFVTDLPNVEPEFVGRLGPDADPEFVFFTVERLRGAAIAMILLTTAILMTATLHCLRRWRLPAGSLTVVFTGTAAAVNAVWEYPFGWVVLAALAGGITGDVLVDKLDPHPERLVQYRVFAGVVPAVMWLTYYLIMELGYGVNWPAEMWTGTVVMASLSSMLLSYLMQPAPAPMTAERGR